MQIICRSLQNLLKGWDGDDVLDDDDDDGNNRDGDDDGLPTYSHNDKIPPWWGNVSNDKGVKFPPYISYSARPQC